MPLPLSVALCTCNGAAFLPAQLAALLAQTHLPAELLGGAAAATDATPQILADFAARAPFPVRILRNAPRLGVAANFAATMLRAEGELIASCDQDDVWHPDRLARAVAAFSDPAVQLVHSDATLVDAKLKPTGQSLFKSRGIRLAEWARLDADDAFTTLLARRPALGATMTVRASLLRWALPIGEHWIHDEWLSVMASLRGRILGLADELVLYRQHGGNAIGAHDDRFASRVKRSLSAGRLERLSGHLAQLRSLQLALASKSEVPVTATQSLAERISHVEARLAVQGGPLRRAVGVWKELRSGRYAGDAMGHWSALQDLLR